MEKNAYLIAATVLVAAIIFVLIFALKPTTPPGPSEPEKINVSAYELSAIIKEAIAKDDITLCEQILQEDSNDHCKYAVLSTQKGNTITLADCETLKTQVSLDSCVVYVADVGNLEDVSQCSKLANPIAVKECYRKTVISKKDASTCANINETEMPGFKNTCYTLVAQAAGDIQVCANIENNDALVTCEIVATEPRDPTLCERMSTQASRNGCYYRMAVDLEDASLCDNILDDEELFDMCEAFA